MDLKDNQRWVTLMFDEMKIQSDLVSDNVGIVRKCTAIEAIVFLDNFKPVPCISASRSSTNAAASWLDLSMTAGRLPPMFWYSWSSASQSQPSSSVWGTLAPVGSRATCCIRLYGKRCVTWKCLLV